MNPTDCFHRLLWDCDHPDFVKLFEELDPPAFMRQVQAAGFQSVMLFAKDSLGQSLYPTRAGHVHPGLSRDFLGEMTAAAKALGLAVVAYVNGTQDPWLARTKPQWRERSLADRSSFAAESATASTFVCLHSGYVEESLIPQLREVVTGYPVDDLFLDIFGQAHTRRLCACDVCAKEYVETFDRELPTAGGPREHWLEYARWRAKRHDAMQDRVIAAIKQARQDVAIVVNYAFSARQPDSPRGVDYLSLDVEEHTNPLLGVPTYLRYAANLGYNVEVFLSHMQHWWWDWDLRPAAAMQLQAAEILANGGVVCVGSILHPSGVLDPRVMKRLESFNRFTAQREPFCRGAVPLANVAMLHSSSTLTSRSAVGFSHGSMVQALTTLRGAARVLLEGHVPFHVIDSDTLLRKLSGYEMLVLPEQSALDDAAIAAISAYVHGGGLLVAIGPTATEDGNGMPRAAAGLDALLGIETHGPLAQTCGYGQFREAAGAPMEGPLLLEGTWQRVSARGAEVLADLLDPLHGKTPKEDYTAMGVGLPPPTRNVVGAAVTLHRAGKGWAAYVAGPVCTQHGAKTQLEWRDAVLWLIDRLMPKPMLTTDAPPTIEIALTRQGPRTICHVVNYANEKGYSLRQIAEWVPPVFDIGISIRADGVGRVTAYPGTSGGGGTPLEFRAEAGQIHFRLPRLDVHSWVVLDPAAE